MRVSSGSISHSFYGGMMNPLNFVSDYNSMNSPNLEMANSI